MARTSRLVFALALSCAVLVACAPVAPGGAALAPGGASAVTSPAAPEASTLTTADVETMASALSKLDNPNGKYDPAALARLIDSKSVTDAYFAAAVVAAANTATQPGLGAEMKAAQTSWLAWSKGKSGPQIAALTNLGRGPDVPGLMQEAVYQAHLLALGLSSVASASGTGPVGFELGPGDTVKLDVPPRIGGDAPIVYQFAKDADGRWRVSGFGHDGLVEDLGVYYATAD